MHSLIPSADDISWLKWRQLFEPKAGAFGLAVAELPRLNALREILEVLYARFGVFVHHRVFDGDPVDRRVPEIREERGPFIQLGPHLRQRFSARRDREPADSRIAQSGAGRVSDHQQVPAVIQQGPRVAYDMAI